MQSCFIPSHTCHCHGHSRESSRPRSHFAAKDTCASATSTCPIGKVVRPGWLRPPAGPSSVPRPPGGLPRAGGRVQRGRGPRRFRWAVRPRRNALASFEREFAEFVGVKHCVGVANGLDALRLSLKALGVRPGDEVIVPSNTYIATWLAVSEAGARPVPSNPTHAPTTSIPNASKPRSAQRQSSYCRFICTASRPTWTP